MHSRKFSKDTPIPVLHKQTRPLGDVAIVEECLAATKQSHTVTAMGCVETLYIENINIAV